MTRDVMSIPRISEHRTVYPMSYERGSLFAKWISSHKNLVSVYPLRELGPLLWSNTGNVTLQFLYIIYCDFLLIVTAPLLFTDCIKYKV